MAVKVPRPSLGPLDPKSLAGHPHAEAKFDYFYDFSARSDRPSHVLELGREDLSPFHDQLLGLVPDPEYWALLRSKERGLCSWLAGIPTHEGQARAWEAKLLERFAALITVHEGQLLMIRTTRNSQVHSLKEASWARHPDRQGFAGYAALIYAGHGALLRANQVRRCLPRLRCTGQEGFGSIPVSFSMNSGPDGPIRFRV